MTKNPSRSSRTSQRHLSTDYEWDTLPSLDEKFLLPNTSHESPHLPVTGDTTSERKAKKSASHGSGAIPKKPTFGDLETATPEGPDVSAGPAIEHNFLPPRRTRAVAVSQTNTGAGNQETATATAARKPGHPFLGVGFGVHNTWEIIG